MTSAGIGKVNADIAGVSVGTVHALPQRVWNVNLTICKVVTAFHFLCFAINVQSMLNSPPSSNRHAMQSKYSSLKISLHTALRHPLVGVWTRPWPPFHALIPTIVAMLMYMPTPPLPPPSTTANHPPHYPTHYLSRTRNSIRLLSSIRPPLSMRGRYSILRTTRSVSPGSMLPKHPYQHSQ
jgi:hypothetical protein